MVWRMSCTTRKLDRGKLELPTTDKDDHLSPHLPTCHGCILLIHHCRAGLVQCLEFEEAFVFSQASSTVSQAAWVWWSRRCSRRRGEWPSGGICLSRRLRHLCQAYDLPRCMPRSATSAPHGRHCFRLTLLLRGRRWAIILD